NEIEDNFLHQLREGYCSLNESLKSLFDVGAHLIDRSSPELCPPFALALMVSQILSVLLEHLAHCAHVPGHCIGRLLLRLHFRALFSAETHLSLQLCNMIECFLLLVFADLPLSYKVVRPLL